MTTGASLTVTRQQRVDLASVVEKIQAERARVLVGIPMGIASETDPSTSVAVIAAKNEFGSPSDRIPERPFLRVGVNNGMPRYSLLLANLIPKVLQGTVTIDDMLGSMGTVAVGEVQKQIRTGSYKPNSPYTVALKGSSTPLIDTGQMIQSIQWVIERGQV